MDGDVWGGFLHSRGIIAMDIDCDSNLVFKSGGGCVFWQIWGGCWVSSTGRSSGDTRVVMDERIAEADEWPGGDFWFCVFSLRYHRLSDLRRDK